MRQQIVNNKKNRPPASFFFYRNPDEKYLFFLTWLNNMLYVDNRQCKRANAFMLFRCPLDHIPFVIFLWCGVFVFYELFNTMFLLFTFNKRFSTVLKSLDDWPSVLVNVKGITSVGHWLLESWWLLKEPFFVCLFVFINIYITWTRWEQASRSSFEFLWTSSYCFQRSKSLLCIAL